MQQLCEACGRRIDEMSEEELLQMYVAASIEGLIKGDSN